MVPNEHRNELRRRINFNSVINFCVSPLQSCGLPCKYIEYIQIISTFISLCSLFYSTEEIPKVVV